MSICRRSGRAVAALLLPLLVQLAGCADRPRPEGGLVFLDSVLLAESDSASLGRPVVFTSTPWGEYWIGDRFSEAVLRFDQRGQFVGRVGQRGSGPGEFRSIFALSPLGGRVVAIADSRRRITSFFDSSGRYLDSTVVLESVPGDVRIANSYLIATNTRHQDSSAFVRWDLASGAKSRGGKFPALWRVNPFVATLGGPLVVPGNRPDEFVAAYGGSEYLFTWSTATGVLVDSTLIPTRKRRGVPTRLPDLLSSPRVLDSTSVLYHLDVLPSGHLAVAFLDLDMLDLEYVGRFFLTVIDRQGRPLLVDGEIPGLAPDIMPRTAMNGDTLLVLVQPIEGTTVRTFIRRYILDLPR